MTPPALPCLLLVAAGLGSVASFAQELSTAARPADAGTHFAAGAEAFARADYAVARDAFEAAISAGSEGPSAHYNLAVSRYRLGDYAAAESAFLDLGRRFPAMRSLADYNRGLALVQQNRPATAREAFLDAALADDETVSTLALAMLERLPEPAAATPRTRWTRLFDLGIGHDDNVQLIDPIALPAGASTDSPFVEIALFASGPVAGRDVWQLAANAYLLEFSEASDYDQHVLQFGASRESSLRDWRLTLRPRLARAYIGGDGFEQSLGAALGLIRDIADSGSTFGIEITYDSASAIDDAFAYIDGDRYELALRHDRRLPRSDLSLEYRLSIDDRAGPGVSAHRDRYRIRWRRRLTADWNGDFVLEFRNSDYDRLQTPRQEERMQTGIRAIRSLGDSWQLGLSLGYANNDSNDAIYAYRRTRLAVAGSRVF